MNDPLRYQAIASHYEKCLERHGDSHLGVDWPKAEDVNTRYAVMLDVIRAVPARRPVQLLDFGCGASHLYEYMLQQNIPGITYSGLDISEPFINLSARKFPQNQYWCMDVLTQDSTSLPGFDYVVMNGVFTEKVDLSFDEMLDFLKRVVTRAFDFADIGIAFNVMSKHVDWERDDLFHLPFDDLANWLTREISRNFVIRSDYGLYEYTTHVYR